MGKRILAPKKQAWAKNRSVTLRGDTLRPNLSLENNYAKDIIKLINQLIKETEMEISDFFISKDPIDYFGQDASITSMAKALLKRLENKFEKEFKEKSKEYVKRMVSGAKKSSESSLKKSLKTLSGGLSIRTDMIGAGLNEIIKAAIEENTSLITTIQSNYLQSLRSDLLSSITNANGMGLKEVEERINKNLNNRGKKIKNKARNIALDQTRKLYNNMNIERAKKAGILEFEWVHSGRRVNARELHVSYNGDVFRFDDPPIIDERTGERGLPGQAINCGCTFRPVFRTVKEE